MAPSKEKEITALAQAVLAEMKKAIDSNEHCWDAAYRLAYARNQFSIWFGQGRDAALAVAVANGLNAMLELSDPADVLSTAWYVESHLKRRNELIELQTLVCDDIDAAKARLEAATEAKKSSQATIDESTSRLRNLSRQLNAPYVHPLPPPPQRQQELPIIDGEEWRAVPMSEVLKGDIGLKSVVAEKLGEINLGQYCDMALKFGQGEKPKKLTRKQWDRVEELVQAFHASNKKAE